MILKLIIILAFVLGILGTLGLIKYRESSVIAAQADQLIKGGKPEEAILLYQKALEVFPFRRDLQNNLAGAQLVAQSNLDYGQIYQIGSEFQEEPVPSQPPPVTQLAPDQFFVPVLMYHHIRDNPRPADPIWAALNVTPEQLDSQLQYLVSHNFHTITFNQLLAALNGQGALPENPIVLTFDDGYRNFYENAFPLLKKYQMKAVQFVITKVVGSEPYLSWNQIVELDKSGLVQIGAHTRHHPNLPDISQKMIIDEISGSKQDLESHLRHKIDFFCYPYGSYNNSIIQTVKDVGFLGAASTVYGAVQSKNSLYLIPRIMVDGRFSLANLISRIQR